MNIFQKPNKKVWWARTCTLHHTQNRGRSRSKIFAYGTIDHVLGKDGRRSARAGPEQLYFSIQVEKMPENCQKLPISKNSGRRQFLIYRLQFFIVLIGSLNYLLIFSSPFIILVECKYQSNSFTQTKSISIYWVNFDDLEVKWRKIE